MKNIQQLPLQSLLLDPQNPRIHQDEARKKNQLNLAKYIYSAFGIDDLKDSFLKNGYFEVEPMIGFKNKDDTYTIVEGNRRLTTIKILCESEYRKHIISEEKHESYRTSKKIIDKLQNIPVWVVEKREDVQQYLAIRHLTGIRKWKPLSQSKYIFNELNKQIEKNKQNINDAVTYFQNITNMSKTNILHNYYQYILYKECNNILDNKQKHQEDYSLDDKFSLLEVSFGKTGNTSITKYLSINTYVTLAKDNQYENIIPEDSYDRAMNFLNWVFKKHEPAFTDSRNINTHLKKILNHPDATEKFEEGATKEDALLLANPPEIICGDSCERINKELVNIEKYYFKIHPQNIAISIKKRFKTSVLEKADTVKRRMNIK